MIGPENKDMDALQKIADEIADYRREYIEGMYNDIARECDEVVESEYDPARGNGRGPWWADGG